MTYPARGVGHRTADSDIEELFARMRAVEATPDIEADAPPLPIITAAVPITGLADSATTDVDFSTGALLTNDGGLAWPGTPSDPFTGDYYSFDWGADPNEINIIAPGSYLIRYSWWIIDFTGSFSTIGQNFFAMIMEGTGDWGNSGDSADMDRVVAYGAPGFTTAFKTEDERGLFKTTTSPTPVSQVVGFMGQAGLTVADAFAAVSIVRLGNF